VTVEVSEVRCHVNGEPVTQTVPVRRLLSDFLRHDLRLTGTHVGCEHGVCGACTVHVDGVAMRSCLLLAVQVDGAQVTTIEGLAGANDPLHPLQEAFKAFHGLQCGFCTPGFVMAILSVLEDGRRPDAPLSESEAREIAGGNLCRCTGYQGIVAAVQQAHESLREHRKSPQGGRGDP
jgi:aerobic carbon-monoxide dehydrogenase small subunit